MKRIAAFILSLVFGAGLAAALLPAQAQEQAIAACPDRLVATPSLVCSCTAAATRAGSVRGSDLYTDDSFICRSAVHSGVIGLEGGNVWVFERPGLASYPAVTRNAVSSVSGPASRRSIAFRPAADATAATARTGPQACPANVAGLAEGTMVTCACTIEAMSAGSIWGDQVYTADSILCRAARHAGVLGPYGGTVRARVVAGQSSYSGAERNGIASGNWAAYRTSLTFDRQGPAQ